MSWQASFAHRQTHETATAERYLFAGSYSVHGRQLSKRRIVTMPNGHHTTSAGQGTGEVAPGTRKKRSGSSIPRLTNDTISVVCFLAIIATVLLRITISTTKTWSTVGQSHTLRTSNYYDQSDRQYYKSHESKRHLLAESEERYDAKIRGNDRHRSAALQEGRERLAKYSVPEPLDSVQSKGGGIQGRSAHHLGRDLDSDEEKLLQNQEKQKPLEQTIDAQELVQEKEQEVLLDKGENSPQQISLSQQTQALGEDADQTSVTNEMMDPLVNLSNFKEVWGDYKEADIPVFWHIPKAGGSTVKDVIGSCHRQVMATEFGVTDGHDQDSEIAVVYPKVPGSQSADRSPFVNVDTTTIAGIQRAKRLGFADSRLVDCAVTPFLYEANDLFTMTAKGRLFSLFRHPVDRAVSMFYYLQIATWEPTYRPELQSWTLEQYARSSVVENNWMTRQLSGTPGGDMSDAHLERAMEIVRKKFLVGITEKLEESMSRFEKFFRWKYRVNPTNQEACRSRLTTGGSNSNKKHKKEKAEPGDPAWELLAAQNLYDIQLYQYIETLFEEQGALVATLPEDFRLRDATCCKCQPPSYPPEGFRCPKAIQN